MVRELRYAARRLWRSKRFLALTVGTLALGIGAASTIYSAADAALLHPFPALDHPDRVVWLTARDPRSPAPPADAVLARQFLDWRSESRSFEAFTVVGGGPSTLGGALPIPVEGWEVGADYFRVLGVSPALGRTFLSD